HEQARIQVAAAFEASAKALGGRIDTLDVLVEVQVYTALAHFGRQRLAHILVETAQEQITPIDQMRLHAQAAEDARKLHGDIPTADDGDGLRQVRQVKRLVRTDGVLATGHVGQEGAAPGGDQ